jgi:hypothetical protein
MAGLSGHNVNLLTEVRKPFLKVADVQRIFEALVVYLDAPFGKAAH